MEPSLLAANPHSIAIQITSICSIAYLAYIRTIFYSCRLCCISWCSFCCTSCWPLLYITFAFLVFIGLLLPTLFSSVSTSIFRAISRSFLSSSCFSLSFVTCSSLVINDMGLRHQFPPRSLIADICCEIIRIYNNGIEGTEKSNPSVWIFKKASQWRS